MCVCTYVYNNICIYLFVTCVFFTSQFMNFQIISDSYSTLFGKAA